MTDTIADAVTTTDAAIARLQDVLAAIGDGDLHRAHRDGGWTVAQLVSHIDLCALLWVGDLQRLRDDPELDFLFREEVGHDAVGYPPPGTDVARRQLDSARRTLARSVTALEEGVGARVVTIPDLGTMSVAEWTPLILGHLAGHVQQALDVLADRDALPAGVA